MEIIKLKNVIIEIKKNHWMGSIVEMTEDQISNLEGISVEFIYCSQKK